MRVPYIYFPVSFCISGGRNSLSSEGVEIAPLGKGDPSGEPDVDLVRDMHSLEFIAPRTHCIAESQTRSQGSEQSRL